MILSFTSFLKYHLCKNNLDFFLLLSLSFIAKGLAMCRLGGGGGV